MTANKNSQTNRAGARLLRAYEQRSAISNQLTIKLTAPEQATFVKTLLKPPAPGAGLRAAAKRHRKLMGA